MSVTQGTTESVADLLGRYLSDELEIDTFCLTFWREHPKYGRLALGALRALSVHASSGPLERVCSHGSIFMRPHRAGMSETTMSALAFLKCNSGSILDSNPDLDSDSDSTAVDSDSDSLVKDSDSAHADLLQVCL